MNVILAKSAKQALRMLAMRIRQSTLIKKKESNSMTKTVICKDVFGNEYETPIDDLDVRIGVYAVIIRDNKILLARQWDGYSIIGGGVEKGETLEEAFTREIEEETGLKATPGKLIHHATTFFKRDENLAPASRINSILRMRI